MASCRRREVTSVVQIPIGDLAKGAWHVAQRCSRGSKGSQEDDGKCGLAESSSWAGLRTKAKAAIFVYTHLAGVGKGFKFLNSCRQKHESTETEVYASANDHTEDTLSPSNSSSLLQLHDSYRSWRAVSLLKVGTKGAPSSDLSKHSSNSTPGMHLQGP